jgi:hypothetical protein
VERSAGDDPRKYQRYSPITGAIAALTTRRKKPSIDRTLHGGMNTFYEVSSDEWGDS